MREIKFNVWDKKTKIMHLWESSEISLDSEGLIYYSGKFHPDYQDRFIFLQFTELKDKDGRRIFDGDILNCIHRKINKYVVVEFDKDKFAFVIREPHNPEYSRYIKEFTKYNKFEVIGNIYENPELMEVKE